MKGNLFTKVLREERAGAGPLPYPEMTTVDMEIRLKALPANSNTIVRNLRVGKGACPRSSNGYVKNNDATNLNDL